MLEIVQTPLARRLWKISKFFQIPINDPRIQAMTVFDLDFYEYSMVADDPKLLERLNNHFYDPDFDDWAAEFDEEMKSEEESEYEYSEYEVKEDVPDAQFDSLDTPDKETITYVENQAVEDEFEVIDSVDERISDWEEVN